MKLHFKMAKRIDFILLQYCSKNVAFLMNKKTL